MPYHVKKSGSGYKVSSPHRTFSKKPLSKKRAMAQMRAIYANTHGEGKGESYTKKLDRALGISDEGEDGSEGENNEGIDEDRQSLGLAAPHAEPYAVADWYKETGSTIKEIGTVLQELKDDLTSKFKGIDATIQTQWLKHRKRYGFDSISPWAVLYDLLSPINSRGSLLNDTIEYLKTNDNPNQNTVQQLVAAIAKDMTARTESAQSDNPKIQNAINYIAQQYQKTITYINDLLKRILGEDRKSMGLTAPHAPAYAIADYYEETGDELDNNELANILQELYEHTNQQIAQLTQEIQRQHNSTTTPWHQNPWAYLEQEIDRIMRQAGGPFPIAIGALQQGANPTAVLGRLATRVRASLVWCSYEQNNLTWHNNTLKTPDAQPQLQQAYSTLKNIYTGLDKYITELSQRIP